jgi:hypothetical protein
MVLKISSKLQFNCSTVIQSIWSDEASLCHIFIILSTRWAGYVSLKSYIPLSHGKSVSQNDCHSRTTGTVGSLMFIEGMKVFKYLAKFNLTLECTTSTCILRLRLQFQWVYPRSVNKTPVSHLSAQVILFRNLSMKAELICTSGRQIKRFSLLL